MKYLLLAKSNVRKTKGLTIGLILLISLAACFLNVFLLINLDFNKNANNVAKELNTEDAYFLVSGGNTDTIDEEYIKSITENNIKDLEITKELSFVSEFPYGDGKISAYALIGDKELFNNKIGKFEILKEDKNISDNYIYIPYQFYTGGGFDLGDIFKFNILGREYSFKIKGFINTITLGSNNVGAYQLILSDDAYSKVISDANGVLDSLFIKVQIKDGVNVTKFTNKTRNKILEANPDKNVMSMTLPDAIFGRTFLGIIFSAILLIVCAIVLIIVILMLSNNISNFIRENIKTLGALKALGYTNKDIKIGFISEFLIIDIIGNAIGIISSVFVMQLIGNIMVVQSAVPYTAHFKFITILITQISLICIVFLSLLFFLRKTKNIEPIVALREGMDSKGKKKNILPLEKSNMPLTLNLSIKTMYYNIKQNIVTFIITFALIIMSSLSLVLYQNFGINPDFSIMTFELCDGMVNADNDENREIYNYLNNLDGVDNARMVAMNDITIGEGKLIAYILDDYQKLKNKGTIYEGNIPKNDNEIVISGKFADLYDYKIGDDIEVKNGNISSTFKLVGLMQTLNNSGQETIMLEGGAYTLFKDDYVKSYYFDIKDGINLDDIFTDLNNKFEGRIQSTFDFQEIAKGALGSFKMIALAVVVLVFIINALIILLVLYMLIKTLLNKKKKEYGILKALGYTSKNVMYQNAISFMPTIILGVVISSIASFYVVNKIIEAVMKMFGIMRLSFDIPGFMIIIAGVIFIILSFLIALFLSRKIKKIEPYKLIIGE